MNAKTPRPKVRPVRDAFANDIDRVLISNARIMRRITMIGQQIARDFRDDEELILVPILTGALVFCADLMRRLPMRMKIGLIAVKSYPGASVTPQEAEVLYDHLGPVQGKPVLLLDDILDTGNTLRLVTRIIQSRKPRCVRTGVLLRKDRPEARNFPVDYVGFDIPDEFIVGYGLDYGDQYRNLADVVTLRREVFQKPPTP